MISRRQLMPFVTIVLVCSSAVGCLPWRRHQPVVTAPVVFDNTPSLDEVIARVNDNTVRVKQLQSSGATISVGKMPSVQAGIALEQPRRFRLRASTAITGPVFDLGSNEELFWFWTRDLPLGMSGGAPRAIFYGRHEQFADYAFLSVVPVEPSWLIEALGLVHLDPAGQHSGPTPLDDGRLEIRTVMPSSTGELTRVTVIDGKHGYVLQQHVYDRRGQRLASAIASQHTYDATSGTSLPRQIEVQMPPAGLEFRIDISRWVINSIAGDPAQLWTMPRIEGYTPIDLAQAARYMGAPQSPTAPAWPISPGTNSPITPYSNPGPSSAPAWLGPPQAGGAQVPPRGEAGLYGNAAGGYAPPHNSSAPVSAADVRAAGHYDPYLGPTARSGAPYTPTYPAPQTLVR